MGQNTETALSSAKHAPSRRTFLRYVGAGAAAGLFPVTLRSALSPSGGADDGAAAAWLGADGAPAWEPVQYPVPLPGDAGAADDDAARLAQYAVRDALVVPQGFKYTVIAKWGDTFGAEGHRVTVGFNCDYTGLLPVDGAPGEYWLIVNHEYISARPWIQGFEAAHGRPLPIDAAGKIAGVPLLGLLFDVLDPRARAAAGARVLQSVRELCEAGIDDLGITVLRVKRSPDKTFAVVADSKDHFRITGRGTQNVPDGKFRFTGPAAPLLGTPRGTFSNCSGATTPWGTFLTCEENVQQQVAEYVTPAGGVLPEGIPPFMGVGSASATNLPMEFEGLGVGCEPPLDGRQYGWVCEIDPVKRTMKKHTALGRFRHENVALRVEAGRRLAAYMGDDRRGGHVWKFVSDDVVKDPKDPANSALLEKGTLYVARWNGDFTGRWVPLRPDTPLRTPEPQHMALKSLWLPRRPQGGPVAVAVPGTAGAATVDEWVDMVESFALGRRGDRHPEALTLGQLVRPEGAAVSPAGLILAEAFLMANAAGGTPCARPEDLEVSPLDRSVYIAFTDSTGSGDGSPDTRIFPDSAGKNSRQYGAIYRIVEDGDDPASATFKWGRFVSSGEVADGGGGFACADNLAFDPAGNLWMVCDISTAAHNFPVRRDEPRTAAGGPLFPGIFGNSALFMIPTRGPRAGVPSCFATGPCECELTGPTFTADGQTLVLSVQHPGEYFGARAHPAVKQPAEQTRTLRVAGRDGKLFEQRREVPVGSNFPSETPGTPPMPCVVCVTRTP